MPRVSDSATFSADCRQMLHRRNSASPSFHSPLWRSKVRGVDATVKLAPAAPEGVKRSSGSAVRLPTPVIVVSPAMSRPSALGPGLRRVATEHLGPQHGLGQRELAVHLLDGRRLRVYVQRG